MLRPVILFCKALEAGERWITVKPNGPDAKGQPVLVSEQTDGSMKVVGGAGGSLNHLRLTGVKPASAYKDVIAERARNRRESRKAQKARDKALGLEKSKADAHQQIAEQQRTEHRKFVEGVAAAMGWKPEDYKFDRAPHAALPDHVVDRLEIAHDMDMVRKAKAVVDLNRQRILADADARAEADIDQVPLESEDAGELSVQDLDPIRPEGPGLGFSPHYDERAENAGLTEDAVAEEADGFKKPLSVGQRKAAIVNGETARMVRDNLKLIRDSDAVAGMAPKIVEAKKAVALMKLEKRLKIAERAARDARKKVNEATSEPKAYVLDVDDAKVDSEVADAVANDLRTIRTRAFLSEVSKTSDNPTAKLGRHIGVGAYNSINALALAAGGDALVDRSVVDVLGIAGAAEVLSRRLHTDLSSEEMAQVSAGLEDFHLHHYMEASKAAMDRARELQAHAEEIGLADAETGGDLAAMQEINRRRADAINESQKVLGQALGEMEANAALVYALKRGKSVKPFEVSLGKVPVETAIQQVRAIGLQRGDYSIETVAGNRVLSVKPEGLDRLAAPVNRADIEQVRRNMDIISGKHDEDGWLPGGITDRPDLDLHPKPGIATRLAEPFDPSADLESAIRDYIGGRCADGDAAADIVSDLQSADFIRKVGDRTDEYRVALDKVAPLQGVDGKMQDSSSLQPEFEKMADEFVEKRFGERMTPLHRQKFNIDDTATESLHRALSGEPSGVAAYKPIGELTHQDQRSLREFFGANVAKDSPEAAAHRRELEDVEADEPERRTTDMFGEDVQNPAWADWRNKRDALRDKVNAGTISWDKYTQSMHGQEHAYAAVQDLIRSKVGKGFADSYNALNPKSPLKVGRAVIRGNLNHLDSVDPAKREARMAKERALVDGLRERAGGRYASGSVREKLDSIREQQAGFDASQMGFFAEPEPEKDRPLESDERYTLGHEAEREIAALMGRVGQNFKPGQPVKLARPTMSGGKNWARQRAVKMVEANKRVVLSFGTGGGKTLISLAGFTNLHQKGKAKRGLFLVPSIVQGQFGGEALKFLKPGEYKWHAQPGASRNERIAAYKDQSSHFAVMTHQSFRDDMIHLGAGHAGIPESEMSGRLAGMSRAERKDWMRSVMRREGINFDYLTVDEGHNTLNRKGKDDSGLANVTDAMSDNAAYYVNASADPVKNDVSEAFSLLQKMDPDRYTDQPAFMRKYGVDTLAAKDGLRRELARFQYPSKIDPDITASRIERKVDLSKEQHDALSGLDKRVSEVRIARMSGKVDVAGMKELSPASFAGVPEAEHEAVARDLQKNLGILKDAAVRKIINGGAKVDEVAKIAAEKKGQPGVVFAHSLDAVEKIGARLKEEGYRVVTITGKDQAKAKSAKKQSFSPDAGDATADILVASDAAATGLNAQRGRWLVNVDTPQTAMTHAQRNGRINRIGQKNNVDLIDLVADHPAERKDRDRLVKKYALRDMLTTPMESLDDTGLAYFLRQRQVAAESGGFL